jgi:hypothetical protein
MRQFYFLGRTVGSKCPPLFFEHWTVWEFFRIKTLFIRTSCRPFENFAAHVISDAHGQGAQNATDQICKEGSCGWKRPVVKVVIYSWGWDSNRNGLTMFSNPGNDGVCSFMVDSPAVNPPGKTSDTSGEGLGGCRCENSRTGAAKPAASCSNESQAAPVPPLRCGAASAQTESKPTCQQLDTIPKSGASRYRACLTLSLSKVRD